jgi:DNA-binding transcriptional regulator YiaG
MSADTHRTALRRIREEHGFRSRRRFAAALNVSAETPRYWERGLVHPHPKHQRRLTALLGLPIDVILAPETTTTTPKDGR